MRAHLLLLLLGVIVWARSIHGSFVNYDTPWLVIENPLLSGGDPSIVPAIFTDLSLSTRLLLGAEYLPIRDLSVLADFAVFGTSWWGHHTHNLLWYLLSCGLLLSVFQTLLKDDRKAWLAAAVYMVHPLHVESVSWLASRKDVISLAFFFASILGWLRGGWRWGVASVFCLGLAYWSKNTAITLPAVLVVLSLLHARQSPLRLRWWLQWIPYGLLALLGLALTFHVGGMVSMLSPVRADSAWGVLTIEVQVIGRYLRMIVAPYGLSVRYPEPEVASLIAPMFLLGLAALGGLLASAAALCRARPVVSLGILWFFITLLPVSQIVPIQNLIADRYLLIPSAGLILAAVSCLPASLLRKPAGVAAAAGILLTLSAATWQRSAVWHSSQALWADLVEKNPADPYGWTSLIGVAVEDGRLDDADLLVGQGLTVLPDEASLLQSRGIVAMKRGKLADAEEAFVEALILDPDLRKSRYNLMLSLDGQGRSEAAVEVGRALVSEHPLYEAAWNGLGAVYIDLGQPEAAQAALEEAYALNPYSVSTNTNLGNAAFLLGDSVSAEGWWRAVLRLEPGNDYARRGLKALGATDL